MEAEKSININKDDLCHQFNWYYSSIMPLVQRANNDFFGNDFVFRLISLSKNINVMFQGEDYFVTKIRVDKNHQIFFRMSSDGVKKILENCLGKSEKPFDLAEMTQLEAKIVSSFNDFVFTNIAKFITEPSDKNSRKDLTKDILHLTFMMTNEAHDFGEKFIISIPRDIITPKIFKGMRKKFDLSLYKNCPVYINIKIGSTRFALKDVKNLEIGDTVIFENSNIRMFTMVYGNFEKQFQINPNVSLIVSMDDEENDENGGNIMVDTFPQDLWDNIQVDMGAEFEKVKISLGELKSIEQGLVIDIGSVYENRVALKVENKTVAEGELVIINDRYGVRIDKIMANETAMTAPKIKHKERVKVSPEGEIDNNSENMPEDISENIEPNTDDTLDMDENNSDENLPTPDENQSDEEFDYSDFELDDEDI